MKNESSNVLGHLIEVTGDFFIARLTSDLEGLSSDKMIGMDKVRVGQAGAVRRFARDRQRQAQCKSPQQRRFPHAVHSSKHHRCDSVRM